jgi:hypothetical protein
MRRQITRWIGVAHRFLELPSSIRLWGPDVDLGG